MRDERAPVLLTMADFYGTLAAARALGRAGISVTMAEGRVLAPARWSRFVRRRVACPPASDTHAYIAWLLEFGQREPGHVLYATTDDLAWLYALHREELGRVFRMVQPPVATIYTLLNKKRLDAEARAVGIDTPRTWFPSDARELSDVGREATFPLLIKPQTQILFESHMKGMRVDTPSGLSSAYAEFSRRNRYEPRLLEFDPEVVHPMLQSYYAEAAQGIYSLSGFTDASGERFVVRAAVKVLQRPRRLGIGLCFEHAEVQPELANKVAALLKRVGYHGVFEAELIQAGGRYLLIDLNPRYYSQMGFDIARGLPLPLLVHAAASGDRARLDALVERARSWRPVDEPVYANRMILELLLCAQGLSGRLSADEVRTWRSWMERHRADTTDAVLDAEDWAPALVDAALHLVAAARHPRGFVRTMVLDQ